jgi:fatty-acyl-CoA synthase
VSDWSEKQTIGALPAQAARRWGSREAIGCMLKVGGETVDPMEVEAFLMAHPGINLAAVVGYPDARLNEVGVAFVRREPGHPLTADEALAHCRGRIASFKSPRHVVFVDEFPMTSSGKIQKAQLRDEVLRRLPPPDARR